MGRRNVITLAAPEGAAVAEFNPEQWARDHERLDAQRFGEHRRILNGILRVLSVAGTILIGVLGWSLKTQYDGMAMASARAAEQIEAIQGVKAQVKALAN